MKKFSRIRFPNRRQRRMAFRTSSVQHMMSWGILHPRRLKYMSDTIFRSTPLFDYLQKSA